MDPAIRDKWKILANNQKMQSVDKIQAKTFAQRSLIRLGEALPSFLEV